MGAVDASVRKPSGQLLSAVRRRIGDEAMRDVLLLDKLDRLDSTRDQRFLDVDDAVKIDEKGV